MASALVAYDSSEDSLSVSSSSSESSNGETGRERRRGPSEPRRRATTTPMHEQQRSTLPSATEALSQLGEDASYAAPKRPIGSDRDGLSTGPLPFEDLYAAHDAVIQRRQQQKRSSAAIAAKEAETHPDNVVPNDRRGGPLNAHTSDSSKRRRVPDAMTPWRSADDASSQASAETAPAAQPSHVPEAVQQAAVAAGYASQAPSTQSKLQGRGVQGTVASQQETASAKERMKLQRLRGQSGIGEDFRTWRSEEEMRLRQHFD